MTLASDSQVPPSHETSRVRVLLGEAMGWDIFSVWWVFISRVLVGAFVGHCADPEGP